jgi:hypothetical protein
MGIMLAMPLMIHASDVVKVGFLFQIQTKMSKPVTKNG